MMTRTRASVEVGRCLVRGGRMVAISCVLLIACEPRAPQSAADKATLVKLEALARAQLFAEAATKSQDDVLRPGEVMHGELTANDPVLDDDSHYDRWWYTGTADEAVSVTMSSEQVDSYLIIGRQTADGDVEWLSEDDDSGGGLDARIELTLDADGEYIVLANTVGAGETGAYTLRLELSLDVVDSSDPETDWAARYPGGGDPRERYALLVGIDDYPGFESDLNGPVADARIMADVLIRQYGFRPANVVMVVDDQASREHIIQAFLRHLGQAGPDGVAVFYYSGHGMQLESNEGIAGPLDPEADGVDEALYVWGEDDASSVLLDDELGVLADRLSTDRVLLVLDACYSGTGSRGAGGGRPKVVTLADVRSSLKLPDRFEVDGARVAGADDARAREGIADVLNQPQRHILLAASSDQELSWTASGWPDRGGIASVFTYYLASRLDGAPPELTFEELMAAVTDETLAYAMDRYQARQTPQLEGSRGSLRIADFLARR